MADGCEQRAISLCLEQPLHDFRRCLHLLADKCWYTVHSCITNPLATRGANLGRRLSLFVTVHRPSQLVALTSIDALSASVRSGQ